MQSSGATLFSYLLSQRKNTISVLDLFCDEVCPNIRDDENDVFIKCTVSNVVDLQQHIDCFNPDLTIFFKRDIGDVVKSLRNKGYANKCGSIDEKIKKYNQIISSREMFDLEYSYEEMISRKIGPLKGLIDQSSFDFKRTVNEVVGYNCLNSSWCGFNFRMKWAAGNIHHKNGNVRLKLLNKKLFL